jgi:hypothetical protein
MRASLIPLHQNQAAPGIAIFAIVSIVSKLLQPKKTRIVSSGFRGLLELKPEESS